MVWLLATFTKWVNPPPWTNIWWLLDSPCLCLSGVTLLEIASLLRREFRILMFGFMRRIFLLLSLCAACLTPRLCADDRAAEAAARAQRDEAEERYKLLNGKLENLTETQELLLKRQDK